MPRLGNILLVIFLAILRMANAQSLKFEQFTTKDGLLSDEVYNLHQDKKGYIWIFTHYGPMKYNGAEFVPVLKNLSFKESVIYAIYENEQGRKWVANSNKNIYEIINDSAFAVEGTQVYSEELRKATNEIYQLIVDDSLNIYAKTSIRTFKFSRLGPGKYRQDNLNALLSKKDDCDEHVLTINNNMMSTVCVDAALWTYESLGNHVRLHQEKAPLSEPGIFFYAVQRSKYWKRFGNAIYFSFFNKIIRLESNGSFRERMVDTQILNFTKDHRGHLWLACYRNGLVELDEHDSIVNHYFIGKTINDVMADSHNGLWISTDGAGIYHCKNVDELYYNESDPFGKPVNFIKKIGDKIFVSTTDFNLLVIENGKVNKIEKSNNELFDDPQSIYYYPPFYVVCYTLHYEILNPGPDGKLRSRLSPFELSLHKPLTVIPYSDSAMLFLSRNRLGIVDKASQLKDHKAIILKNVFINRKAFCVARLGKGVFVGTEKGVFCFENDSLFQPAYLKGTEKCMVTKIVADSLGNIWFCTQGNGLLKLNQRKELLSYTTANGLSSNITNDVFFMKDGSVLLSNNKGLYHYTGFSNLALSGGRKLLDGEVQSSLVFKGKIYVGTKNGLVLLDARSLQPSPQPFFNLRAVYVNDEQTSEHQIGALNYRRNNLRFTFDVIAFSEEKYALEYVLYNNTVDSGMVNDDEVDLKRLAPGCYTLTVRLKAGSSQQTGLNNKVGQEISLPFTIVPAFWQTAWFLVLMIFLGLVLIIVAGRILFKYYRVRALRKSESEKLIAEYRLIALKAQINPHFMSNCIAAIQHLILQNKVNEANEYLAKFSFLVRQVLNLSNKSLVLLKEEIEIIELYIKLEKLRFDKITVEFHIDPQIDVNSTFIPPLLSQPIIENAIWHGLLALGPDKTPLLLFSIKREAGTIRIIIEDNGVGRSMSGKSISNSRESKGIAITRQRIENLKFISGQDLASLSYEDLLDANGAPVGTRVVISLPDNLHI
jgi:ligand-binding sensor domain-containing protein